MAAENFNPFQNGFRLTDGTKLNRLFQANQKMQAINVSGNATVGSLTNAGSYSQVPQLLTAAGTTQLGAAAILATTALALITVSTTASTHGVRLPTASTGLSVQVGNGGTFGVKVYPSTNGKIGAVATNGADGTVLAINKVNTYYAINKTYWIVDRGA